MYSDKKKKVIAYAIVTANVKFIEIDVTVGGAFESGVLISAVTDDLF